LDRRKGTNAVSPLNLTEKRWLKPFVMLMLGLLVGWWCGLDAWAQASPEPTLNLGVNGPNGPEATNGRRAYGNWGTGDAILGRAPIRTWKIHCTC
jgi:hypothetical protein